jgi:hypothetical protein
VKTLRRLRKLSHPESVWLFGWSLLTVFLTAVLMRTRSLPALLRHLARPSHARFSRGEAQPQLDTRQIRTIWRYSHVIVTSLLHSRRPCLLRSLVVYRYGCRYGLPISIHFGVKSGIEGLEGHSWVALHGSPLCESEERLESYVAVYSYPEGSSETGMPQVLAAVGG